MNRYSEYDTFAWIYNKHLGPESARRSIAVVRELVLDDLPDSASILDLCCGTGQLLRELTKLGFETTGLDGSQEMLHYAEQNAPEAQLITADARDFQPQERFDLIISAFDSLNHVMKLDEVGQVFKNAGRSLKAGGRFLFDLNMEDGYKARWHGSTGIVEEDNITVISPSFDEESKIGSVPITIMRQVDEIWYRSDVTLTQKCYSHKEISGALHNAGFTSVETYSAQDDLQQPNGIGRSYFLSMK